MIIKKILKKLWSWIEKENERLLTEEDMQSGFYLYCSNCEKTFAYRTKLNKNPKNIICHSCGKLQPY